MTSKPSDAGQADDGAPQSEEGSARWGGARPGAGAKPRSVEIRIGQWIEIDGQVATITDVRRTGDGTREAEIQVGKRTLILGVPNWRERALRRVRNHQVLCRYEDLIMSNWQDDERHWRWVATSSVRDVVDWVEAVEVEALGEEEYKAHKARRKEHE